ncbi:MAG: S8 family peptidase [Solirubrobacteraceae bacterium]
MSRSALLAVVAAALLPAGAVAAQPAPATGRLLVLLDQPAAPSGATARASAARARAVIASAEARRSGHSAPQIGLVTLRPRVGESLAALAARLRADPRVASVQLERRATPREVPNDPALTTPETAIGTPAGTVVQWWAARQHLPEAWDVTHGEGALVAVIDQGIDGAHPEFAGRIRDSIDLDNDAGSGSPLQDSNGHGTHVASMACAAAGNGIGLAGAGYGCDLLVIKSDLTDSSIATAIVRATDRGADSINMSFGQDGREDAPASEKRAIKYAYDHDVVLVAAAADQPVTEQGDPANALQPSATGPVLGSGKGLSVTAADFDDRRAPFAGFGTQISLAAYGTFHYRPVTPAGPLGIFGAFPSNATEIESDFPPCNCRTTFGGDDRYAYLQGTSMAAPMVAAVAALMRNVNPGLHAKDVIRLLEQTASRPDGTGWSEDLGWGIINAGAAVAAGKALDRTRPSSKLTAPRQVKGRRTFVLRWTGRDAAPAGLTVSGVARYEVWRSIGGHKAKRIAVTRKRRLTVHGTPARTYAFFTRAIDKAGNRELATRKPDARTRVVRR